MSRCGGARGRTPVVRRRGSPAGGASNVGHAAFGGWSLDAAGRVGPAIPLEETYLHIVVAVISGRILHDLCRLLTEHFF